MDEGVILWKLIPAIVVLITRSPCKYATNDASLVRLN